jgi:hypothetical protein
MEPRPAMREPPRSRVYPHDEYSQREQLHRLIDALPQAMLGPTLALLLDGPRYLVGLHHTLPPET